MTAYRPRTSWQDGDGSSHEPTEAGNHGPILGAVREDIRQTLRTGWIDPAACAGVAAGDVLAAGARCLSCVAGGGREGLLAAVGSRPAPSVREMARRAANFVDRAEEIGGDRGLAIRAVEGAADGARRGRHAPSSGGAAVGRAHLARVRGGRPEALGGRACGA